MERLHRIHAVFILCAAVFRALSGFAFLLLLVAGIIWAIHWGFSGRPATVLTVWIILWALLSVLRAIGELLGPPEPSVKSTTRLETRRELRRAGMLRRR
jgi:hypothetical protein